MKPDVKTFAAIGIGLAAALGVGLAIASSTSTPAPPGGSPWLLTQGHRYKVTLSAGTGAANFSTLNPSAILSIPNVSYVANSLQLSGGGAGSFQAFASYLIDYTGPTQNEPASVFLIGAGGAVDVTLQDLGLSPSQTATATGPSSSTAIPPGATSPGGPTTGPFGGYGPPYQPPASGGAGGTAPPAGSTPTSSTPTLGPAPTNPPTTSPTPATPTPPNYAQTPTGSPGSWQPATSAPFLWGARWTMTPDQVSAFVASTGGTGNPLDMSNPKAARASFEQTLLLQRVQGILQSRVFFVWAPGDAVPTDWPPDDAHIADGYHVEIVYGIGYATATASIPNPPALAPATLQNQVGLRMTGFWTQTQGPGQTLTRGDIFYYPATQINAGDLVRASFSAADIQQLTYQIAIQPGIAGAGPNLQCTAFFLYANDPGNFASVYGTAGMLAWCPNDQLPPDWPPDDAQAASEFHLQFRAGSTVTAFLMPSTQVWVAQGSMS